jgi:two-component system nitrate/nitrite response regulator NarL
MRIAVADDHPLYREAVHARLKRLYPEAAIAEAATLDELLALAATEPLPFDLVLMDLRMPGVDEAAGGVARVIEAFRGSPVAVISGAANAAHVHQIVQVGAHGFLPKTMATEPFAAALALLVAGGTYLPTEVLGGNFGNGFERPVAGGVSCLDDSLTPREKQVLGRLSAGASNKEIGRELGLAEVTIKLHVRQILKKIGARNRSEAAVLASKAGLS